MFIHAEVGRTKAITICLEILHIHIHAYTYTHTCGCVGVLFGIMKKVMHITISLNEKGALPTMLSKGTNSFICI